MTVPSAVLDTPPAGGWGTPTATVQDPTITITVQLTHGGTPHTVTNVKRAHTALGYDMQVGEASFAVHLESDLQGATYFSEVSITLKTSGSPRPWRGYILDVAPAFDESGMREVVVTCKGYLVLTTLQPNRTPGGTLPLPALPAITGNPDEYMAGVALAACGITAGTVPHYTINGTGRNLGTVAREPFRWAEGETALSYISRLDEISAVQLTMGAPFLLFRTYDDSDGAVVRDHVDMVPSGSAVATFTEGVDIYHGGTDKDITPARNEVVVIGYDADLGTGPATNTQSASNSFIPAALNPLVLTVSNPMIEFSLISDLVGGKGIAAEEVAKALLRIWNRVQERVTYTTHRDDDLSIGATVAIATGSGSAERLGVTGDFWLQHVERDIDADGHFTQTLTVIAGGS